MPGGRWPRDFSPLAHIRISLSNPADIKSLHEDLFMKHIKALLAIVQFDLHENTQDSIDMSVTKNVRVKADYCAFSPSQNYDIRGRFVGHDKFVDGKQVTSRAIYLTIGLYFPGGKRVFYNGNLHQNKKTFRGVAYDYSGKLRLDNEKDGPTLSLFGFNHSSEAERRVIKVSLFEGKSKKE